MKFIDRVQLQVQAGNGGNGIVAFLHEKFRPRGGPSGGDGGNGGSIYIQGDHNLTTLVNLAHQAKITASNGNNGQQKNMHGKAGKDTIIAVPLGTIIKNKTTNEVIADITADQEKILLARGGRGGRGNARFATSANRTPRICENGQPGESFSAEFELQVIADVGLVGLPNAGKSTLIRSISNARPQVADFPFTTRQPELGIVKANDQSFVVADLPGLIAQASQGKGLGFLFLKHINRCRVLAHVISVGNELDLSIQDRYNLIQNELKAYDPQLLEKPQLVVLTKIDLLENEAELKSIIKSLPFKEVIAVSAYEKRNLKPLIYRLAELVQQEANLKSATPPPKIITPKTLKLTLNDFSLVKLQPHTWKLTGDLIEKLCQRNPLLNHQQLLWFNEALRRHKIIVYLKNQIEAQDQVLINDRQFIWTGANLIISEG